MSREKLDFTDRELNILALSIESYLNNRETWISAGKAKVINSTIEKITSNGLKRKNPEKIISPIYTFKTVDNEE